MKSELIQALTDNFEAHAQQTEGGVDLGSGSQRDATAARFATMGASFVVRPVVSA